MTNTLRFPTIPRSERNIAALHKSLRDFGYVVSLENVAEQFDKVQAGDKNGLTIIGLMIESQLKKAAAK